MEKKQYIAIDLGATSGRTILGSIDADGKFSAEELNRFPNGMIEVNGHLHWDIFSLYGHILEGLTEAGKRGVKPESIAIDTWGVDFGCIDPDGNIMGIPYAYRDKSTIGAAERYFNNVMPARELYAHTGIQHIDFNTVFQFNEQRRLFPMQHAMKIAFIPDLLNYLLTGKIVTEYTIASTGAILNPATRQFDNTVLESVGLTPDKFGPIVEPGTVIGALKADIAAKVGLPEVPVVAVGEHDTASAVAAVPATDECFAYLSSGTWSLMGLESPSPVVNEQTESYNITNEGGIEGTIRVLKNITGMWIVEQCLQAWKKEGTAYSYPEMVALAEAAPEFVAFIDPDDPMFVAPANMPAAIKEYCEKTGQRVPANHGEMIRMIFESLALKYKMTLDVFRSISVNPVHRLHVIGGGSRNKLLNQFTSNAIGLPVIAGPAEATAIGNIMMQAKASGAVNSLHEMRYIITNSIELEKFAPADNEKWENAYKNFLTIIKH
ncbi:MAG: rhamnulokinase [Bacteroides sp.]|nr:rhamnulokinase [Bacteroides sp.]MCM1389048.1 rhamnulokinase [Bacteroides sp.]